MRCGEVAASAVSEFLKFFGQNADGWKSHISYFLNVYRGNPRDGYYFHQLGNDKRTNANENKDFCFCGGSEILMAPQRAVLKFS